MDKTKFPAILVKTDLMHIHKMKIKELYETGPEYFRYAYDLASEGHKDQKRKDGKPYMTHIDAVIENSWELCGDYGHVTQVWYILSCAALHDLPEDNPDFITYEDLYKGLSDKLPDTLNDYDADASDIIEVVQLLTKPRKGESFNYVDYVLGIKSDVWATIVKLSDLKHNLSDLGQGNLRQKYELTKYVLEN